MALEVPLAVGDESGLGFVLLMSHDCDVMLLHHCIRKMDTYFEKGGSRNSVWTTLDGLTIF